MVIWKGCGLSTMCHSCGFACQQRVQKMFPGPGYLRFEDGVVWLWHFLVNLDIYTVKTMWWIRWKRFEVYVNPLSANPTKWSNILTLFVGKLPTICVSVFDHFVKLALKGLTYAKHTFPSIVTGEIFKINHQLNCDDKCVKRKIHNPFKWIQLIEWSNYLNMNSCLHLSNKLKECGKCLWIRLWNLGFISMKEPIFSKVAG